MNMTYQTQWTKVGNDPAETTDAPHPELTHLNANSAHHAHHAHQ